MHTGSALLAPATRAAWEQIQRAEGGAARLLQHFEAYFSNVARNLRRTYLRPFVIVTANMSKGCRAAPPRVGPQDAQVSSEPSPGARPWVTAQPGLSRRESQ